MDHHTYLRTSPSRPYSPGHSHANKGLPRRYNLFRKLLSNLRRSRTILDAPERSVELPQLPKSTTSFLLSELPEADSCQS